MIRGDNLYASGSCWSRRWRWRCSRSPAAGRVRVTVRDAADQGVRAQGPGQGDRQRQSQFISGETDLRGVFVAEGVRGLVTAVARKGDASTPSTAARPTSGHGSRPVPRRRQRHAAGSRQARPTRHEPVPRRQPQDAEHSRTRPARSSAPAAVRSAGRQEKGSGSRRVPLNP